MFNLDKPDLGPKKMEETTFKSLLKDHHKRRTLKKVSYWISSNNTIITGVYCFYFYKLTYKKIVLWHDTKKSDYFYCLLLVYVKLDTGPTKREKRILCTWSFDIPNSFFSASPWTRYYKSEYSWCNHAM